MDQNRSGPRQYIVRVIGGPLLTAFSQVSSVVPVRRAPLKYVVARLCCRQRCCQWATPRRAGRCDRGRRSGFDWCPDAASALPPPACATCASTVPASRPNARRPGCTETHAAISPARQTPPPRLFQTNDRSGSLNIPVHRGWLYTFQVSTQHQINRGVVHVCAYVGGRVHVRRGAGPGILTPHCGPGLQRCEPSARREEGWGIRITGSRKIGSTRLADTRVGTGRRGR